MWRVWATGRATLEELETHWSIVDVQIAHDVLDAELEFQTIENEGPKK